MDGSSYSVRYPLTAPSHRMPSLIALGSNLGNREANIRRAIDELAAHPHVTLIAISSLHTSEAVGGPLGQGAFLNAAAAVNTSLAPHELLDLLLAIESQLGRTREIPWGPRTIDLDLLLYDDQIIDEPGLRVPHPRMHERHFVLAPAAEIAAKMVHPQTGRTIANLLADLESQ